MNIKEISVVALRTSAIAICFALSGCGGGGGGDVEINASNNSVSTNNSTTTTAGSGNNPCASYTDAGGTARQGSFDGTNCNYDSDFVGENNPLTVDLSIPFITGTHVFSDTLQVGANIDGTDPAVVPLSGGQGPVLEIAAGSTLAFTDAGDYLLVNRGSQIIANGSPTAPITLTGFTDAVTGTAGPEDVQLWGGVVINGNGITNKCGDVDRANNGCHILSEGKPSNYGGNDNTDSSGSLQYVVVKHTGFEVAPGDELNGITLNAVGSGTVMSHIQVYSTFDDGVEFFGGAVNVDHLVAVFVKDDSIDYADGWVGRIDFALVIHSATDGNRCIEADNNGGNFGALPTTSPTVANMTCITSGADVAPGGTGTHGDSEGVLLRRGVQTQLVDSIIFDGYGRVLLGNDGNECLELDDDETRAAAAAGTSSIKSVLIACQEATKDSLSPSNSDTVEQWVLNTGGTAYPNNTNNVVIANSDSANVTILGGTKPFFTASSFSDETGSAFTVTAEGGGILGAVDASDDWTGKLDLRIGCALVLGCLWHPICRDAARVILLRSLCVTKCGSRINNDERNLEQRVSRAQRWPHCSVVLVRRNRIGLLRSRRKVVRVPLSVQVSKYRWKKSS